jgi:methionine sulfoxide reductase heme-binding subunit
VTLEERPRTPAPKTPRPAARPVAVYKGLPLPVRVVVWAAFAITVGVVLGATAPTALRRLGAVVALQPGMLAWYAVRAFGFLAYLVLAASVLYGLLLSTKILDAIAHRPVSFALHKDLSIVGLVLAALHGVILVADQSFDFTPRAILVPFASPYSPISVGIGQLTFYASGVILLSFYVRRHIGQRTWRLLHYVTFLSFAGASYHGIASGSDTSSGWAFWIYTVPVTAMVFLTTYRLAVGISNRIRRLRPVPVVAGGGAAVGIGGLGRRADGPETALPPLGPLDRPATGGFLRRGS